MPIGNRLASEQFFRARNGGRGRHAENRDRAATFPRSRPGFFRTGLLDAKNVKYADSTIADYAAEGTAEAMWSGYDGAQPNDPGKLGEALVELARMAAPPRVFAAGSDAIAAIVPVLEGRLAEMKAHEALSRFSGGVS